MLILGADMNAKLIEQGQGEEDGIGKHVFGTDETLREGDGVEENRNMLKEFLIETKTILTNTFFQKRPENQVTYKIDKLSGNTPL